MTAGQRTEESTGNPYLGHAGVNPLQLLQGKVVRQPDEVVAPLDDLGLVNPDAGGNTGILLPPLWLAGRL